MAHRETSVRRTTRVRAALGWAAPGFVLATLSMRGTGLPGHYVCWRTALLMPPRGAVVSNRASSGCTP